MIPKQPLWDLLLEAGPPFGIRCWKWGAILGFVVGSLGFVVGSLGFVVGSAGAILGFIVGSGGQFENLFTEMGA